MITLSTLKMAEPMADTFSLFKQDASIPDEHRDALLRAKLRAALKMVQDVSGRSLLPCTLEVTVDGRDENAPVRLYQRVDKVLEVTDGEGNALEYRQTGSLVQPGVFSGCVVVTYETAPVLDDLIDLQDIVSRVAVALYDGEPAETINAILKEAVR